MIWHWSSKIPIILAIFIIMETWNKASHVEHNNFELYYKFYEKFKNNIPRTCTNLWKTYNPYFHEIMLIVQQNILTTLTNDFHQYKTTTPILTLDMVKSYFLRFFLALFFLLDFNKICLYLFKPFKFNKF